MPLQLPSILDTSSDKRVAFKIMALVEKNLLNLVKKPRKKPYIFNW